MKQLKASVPDELAERLERASAKSGRSLSAEICARVETSFAQEAVDKPTRDFLEGLALLPAEVELETGAAWHKHAGSYEVLVQAILSRLIRYKPKGSTAFGDRPHATVSNDDPNQLGLLIEALLNKSPDYTNSPQRQSLEEAHQKMRADLRKSGTRLTVREVEGVKGRPFDPLDEQAKFDQQRKKGKKP
jgi:hypothetical protein